jgi:hypothetical protein
MFPYKTIKPLKENHVYIKMEILQLSACLSGLLTNYENI